tara:strand:- start:768 stop:968 length:201 start_codon:yes stop_codon:yes gene_type:complete
MSEEKTNRVKRHPLGFMADKAQREAIDKFAAFEGDKTGSTMTREQAMNLLLRTQLKKEGFNPLDYR